MEETQEIKQARKTFSLLGWCYIAGTVTMYAAQMLSLLFIRILKPDLLQNSDNLLILSLVTVDIIALPLIYLLVYRMPTTLPERHKIKWWHFIVLFVMSYALVFICNFFGSMVTFVVGALKGSAVENRVLDYVTESSPLLLFFDAVLIAPVMEELIFRKVLVDRTLKYGQGVSIVLSGLMFGLFHGNFNQFAYAVMLGAFFAFIYIRTGDVRITMAIHVIINFMGSVVATGLMRLIHFEELMQIDTEDVGALMQAVMENPLGWMLYGFYLFFILLVVIAGIILFIVFHKQFRLEAAEGQIPRGQRFRTVILNPGMIAFLIVWVILIIIQLLT